MGRERPRRRNDERVKFLAQVSGDERISWRVVSARAVRASRTFYDNSRALLPAGLDLCKDRSCGHLHTFPPCSVRFGAIKKDPKKASSTAFGAFFCRPPAYEA